MKNMKRFWAILLLSLTFLFCLPAFAEETLYEEFGFALDFSAVQEMTPNYLELHNYRVMSEAPYISVMRVCYYALPGKEAEDLEDAMNSTDDENEYGELFTSLAGRGYRIATIVVTDLSSLEETGVADPRFGSDTATEFGNQGGYHYFYVADPSDMLMPLIDTGEVLGEADIEDIGMIQSELLKQLRAAELSPPLKPGTSFIGQMIRFDSTDLDGSPVSSADLFKDNEITMVNLWGTWCDNCVDEMGGLAVIHDRLREKGCGIVGVEHEHKPIEEVAGTARQILADNGIGYPNVLMPESDPVFDLVSSYPTSFFVDSGGKILTQPIIGARIEDYEPTVDRLLAGEPADAEAGGPVDVETDADAAENAGSVYRVIVSDRDGDPVEGVILQFCDDVTCSFQATDAEGTAVFAVEDQKIYEVHVLQAPEGYIADDDVYNTQETFSDVSIVLEKRDEPGRNQAEEVFEAAESGVVFSVPDSFRGIKGHIDYTDFGDDSRRGEGIVEMKVFYVPMGGEEYDSLWEKIVRAEEAGDSGNALDLMMQINGEGMFSVYGINGGRGIDELIRYLLSELDSEDEEEPEYRRSEKELAEARGYIHSFRYIEIGTRDSFTYILRIRDPEQVKRGGPVPGYEDGYFEEYTALLEDTDTIIENIRLTGGIELSGPVEYAKEGTAIRFETRDLDGNPVRSEDLFDGFDVTMINLWGTWCGPCRQELAKLEDMNRALAEKKCRIIGIVTDADSEEKIRRAKEILTEKGVSYVNLVPFDGLSGLLPQDTWPTSYYVDGDGCLAGEPVTGAYFDQYRETIDALLTDRE